MIRMKWLRPEALIVKPISSQKYLTFKWILGYLQRLLNFSFDGFSSSPV
jgi:hypothetical protein